MHKTVKINTITFVICGRNARVNASGCSFFFRSWKLCWRHKAKVHNNSFHVVLMQHKYIQVFSERACDSGRRRRGAQTLLKQLRFTLNKVARRWEIAKKRVSLTFLLLVNHINDVNIILTCSFDYIFALHALNF